MRVAGRERKFEPSNWSYSTRDVRCQQTKSHHHSIADNGETGMLPLLIAVCTQEKYHLLPWTFEFPRIV
jgi:hypothetical protein